MIQNNRSARKDVPSSWFFWLTLLCKSGLMEQSLEHALNEELNQYLLGPLPAPPAHLHNPPVLPMLDKICGAGQGWLLAKKWGPGPLEYFGISHPLILPGGRTPLPSNTRHLSMPGHAWLLPKRSRKMAPPGAESVTWERNHSQVGFFHWLSISPGYWGPR